MKPWRITIHETDSPFGTLEGLRRAHLRRGWSDIGYHYVITNGSPGRGRKASEGIEGMVWDGRGLYREGAGVRGQNEGNIQIAMVGAGVFTRLQLQNCIALTCRLASAHYIPTDWIRGHHEYDPKKECPRIDMGLFRAAVDAGRLLGAM